jgi:hypothetical protein
MDTVCPHAPAFDIAETAGHYAQVSGLLAGFAFVAIVFLLGVVAPTGTSGQVEDADRRDGEVSPVRSSGVVLVFLVAFFALVVCTVTYSVLAGDAAADGRAASHQVTNGLSLALATVLLFHGISLLMIHGGRVDPTAAAVAQVLAGIVVPVIALFYLYTGVLDIEHLRVAAQRVVEPGFCGELGPATTAGPALVVLLAVVLVVARLVRARMRVSGLWVADHRSAVPVGVLAAASVLAIGSGWISTVDPGFLPARWVVITFLCLACLLLATIGTLILWETRAHEDPASPITEPPAVVDSVKDGPDD